MPDKQEVKDLISKIPLFSRLDEESLMVLAGRFRAERYPVNSVVYRQGDSGKTMYVVFEGRGVLLKADEDGIERRVGTVTHGAVVGTESLFIENERDVTFLIVQPSVLCALSQEAFQAAKTRRRQVGENLNFEERPELEKIFEMRAFSWLQPGEAVLLWSRRHIWAFYRRAMVVFVIGLVLFLAHLFLWLVPQLRCFALPVSVLIVGFVGILTWAFYRDWRNDFFVVTNRRLVHEETVFTFLGQRTVHQAPLDKVENVRVEEEGFSYDIFGYANVRIQTASAEGTIVFDMVPNPQAYQEVILRMRGRHETRNIAERRAEIRREIEKRMGVGLRQEGAAEVLPIEEEAEGAVEIKGDLEAATPMSEGVPEPLKRGRLRRYMRAFRQYMVPNIREEKGDTIIYRKHWFILLADIWQPIFVLFVLGFVLLPRVFDAWPAFMVAFEQFISPVGALLAFFVVLPSLLFWLWWSYEDWRNDLYIITPEMVIDMKATPTIFGDKDELQAPIENIQNVNYKIPRGIRRLLSMGQVLIETAGAQGVLEWNHVYNPEAVVSDVMRAVRAQNIEEEEERQLEQAELFSEWLAVYHQTINPDAYAENDQASIYRAIFEEMDEEPGGDDADPSPPGPPPDTDLPFERL